MRTHLISFILLIFASLALCQSTAPTNLSHFDVAAVDNSVDPCVDFYQYSCNKWLAANPIPPDRAAWGHGSELTQHNQQVLREVLEQASAGGTNRSSVEQKIGDYYGSCMDENTLNQKGAGALKPELARIEAMKSTADLPAEIAHLHAITYNLTPQADAGFFVPLFGFTSTQDFGNASVVVAIADQGGISLPERDYYLKSDPHSVELRKAYIAHVTKMLELAGEPAAQAATDGNTVLRIETALAKVSMDVVARRDPANFKHKLSLEQLQALTPSFQWNAYLKEAGAPAPQHYLVTPDFYKGLETQRKTVPLAQWKTYLRWHVIHASAPLLSDAFVNEDYNFFGRTLIGQKENTPRWRRCTNRIDTDLGEALGQAFVEKAFGPEAKQRMLKMVRALEDALGRDIQQLDWMSSTTKQQAEVKLRAIEDKIGYPDHWRDYSSVNIVRGDLVGDAFRSSEFEFHRQLNKIGKPVDRTEWGMTPPTVNAYYDSQLNTINFPAGMLQPPYFDPALDDAVNFGAIGSVIGHELTHGFDDQGRKFAPNGDLKDWWTAEDGREFERRAKCVSQEYSGFVPVADVHINGDLTLGENTADNGGARIALMALMDTLSQEGKLDKRIDGLTPEQRFFLAFGEMWCSNLTPERMRVQLATNPHSPGRFRVNGVVSNMPEFQKAFGCKAGQPMVRAAACRVW